MSPKLKVAILGSGRIGLDLLIKVRRSPVLECALFIGRNPASPQLAKARELGVRVSADGIDAIMREPSVCDVVFDATSAADHQRHWPLLRQLGKRVIDMTPSNLGAMFVPAVDPHGAELAQNINMVSCGGQASIPMAHALAAVLPDIEYIEAVSSIASLSAGPATRANLDEYIETTERGLQRFSGCARTKAILILNPANPPIHMQTTVSAKVASADLDRVRASVDAMVTRIRAYVPGYELIVPPVYEQNRVVVMVRVAGRGDSLPTYAGNLDIINCAAIAAAERIPAGEVPTPELVAA
ncbi:acetaldehyde dehydrogenase (acetylating) [Actomonas aquatica]|uniref:Acetaldehyde dehydrogenase n=1 Tax=Actomonas aquatica TaxID=2866162 RepID=A0ABZ1CCM4_9BACT|nr:acetaldehyde dehydrogenase (acetylating) [Opitutus sp. WL0086]WRQ89314.1 acetaldehyde dehydrogenase (acetylating) [Opitutus sp. WL0086]